MSSLEPDPGRRFAEVFPRGAVIGMVHVGALPGSPGFAGDVDGLVAGAVREAGVLAEAGFDAVMIENMHDRPYVNGPHGAGVIACMTRVACEVARVIGKLPLGVQVLSRGEREAVAIALAARPAGPAFIRCENFVFSHIADEGLMAEAAAGPLLRYKREIGAEHVLVLADIKKKHASHAITADVPIEDAARASAFFGADAVVVTGAFTGVPADAQDLERARSGGLAVVVGSGATSGGLGELMKRADAVIVGSWIKRDGRWENAVDAGRAREFAAEAKRVRVGSGRQG